MAIRKLVPFMDLRTFFKISGITISKVHENIRSKKHLIFRSYYYYNPFVSNMILKAAINKDKSIVKSVLLKKHKDVDVETRLLILIKCYIVLNSQTLKDKAA